MRNQEKYSSSDGIRFIFRTEEEAISFKKRYKVRNAIKHEINTFTLRAPIANKEKFIIYTILEKERLDKKLLYLLEYLGRRKMSYGLHSSERTAFIYLEEDDKDFKRIFTKWTPEVPHSLEI